MQGVHLIISGDVQGVGYRAWAKIQAKKLALAGWVKNREDGAVEIAAQGERKNLEEFISLCRRGPEVAWVEHVDLEWQKSTGEMVGFEVVY